jgi:hypothetical protein
MKPENMPYYRGPRIVTKDAPPDSDGLTAPPSSADEAHHSHCLSILSAMVNHNCHGLSHLTNVPVRFGTFDSVVPATSNASLNHELPANANRILNFNWAVYLFGGGHFMSTISSCNLPFRLTLACGQYEYGRSLFCEFATCATVFASSSDLLHHIRASGDSVQIHSYLIHSLPFRDSETTSKFWQIQAIIIAQLQSLRNLQVVVAIIIPDHDGKCIRLFNRTLKTAGWCLSAYDGISFMSIGDSVAGTCDFLLGFHSSCTSKVEPIKLKPPPPIRPQPLGDYLWEPFSRPEHSVCLACDDDDFCRQDVRFTATNPSNNTPIPPGVMVRYYIHGHSSDEGILCGATVISVDDVCPPFDAGANQNMFQHLFGIEFHFGDHTHVWGI